MSRRCHHGSPRHPRPVVHERRRSLGLVEPSVAPAPLEPGLEAIPDDLAAAAILAEDLDDAAILEATAAADIDEPRDAPRATGALVVAPTRAPTEATTTEAPTFEPPTQGEPPMRHEAPRPVHPPVRQPRPWTAAAAPMAAPAMPSAVMPAPRSAAPHPDGAEHGATAPQLRRFIKSRAYVPMHELRRRFVIDGGDDDVTPIDVDRQRIYVGLPPREGSLLGELLRAGDIGYELSLDPIAPIVVGVYPMRPVPRS